jgi:hypothetical protein
MSKLTDLTAAINRLAAAIERSGPQLPQLVVRDPAGYTCIECGTYAVTRLDHTATCSIRTPHLALAMPVPKGWKCAADCGRSVTVHREAGCDVDGCDCPAPFGRLMPPTEIPDDLSTLGGA